MLNKYRLPTISLILLSYIITSRHSHTHSQSSSSCHIHKVNMEDIVRIMFELERSLNTDLNTICETANSSQVSEMSDNIKLNISASLTEIKMHIINRVRLRELALVPENSFCKAYGNIAIGLFGKVTNARSIAAKGVGFVAWNKAHTLNVPILNCLTVKSNNSSTQLALLALANQCNQINLKRVHVFSNTSQIAKMVENLPLYHLQGYKDRAGAEMPNRLLLEKIHTAMTQLNIVFIFSSPPIPQTLSGIYETLMSAARCGTMKRMAQIN